MEKCAMVTRDADGIVVRQGFPSAHAMKYIANHTKDRVLYWWAELNEFKEGQDGKSNENRHRSLAGDSGKFR